MPDAQLFLLDTNTASFLMRESSRPLRRRLSEVPLSQQAVSVITEAELRFGVERSANKKKHAEMVDRFLTHVTVMPWDSRAAGAYATLRFMLNSAGRALGGMDMLIAAHALALHATLVTNDAVLLRLSPIVNTVDWTREP
jgi:tRNA(fMet)-specific endonuclease VapC